MIQVSFLLCVRLYKVLSHTLGVSLLPSRRFNPLYAVPPPSSEGGEGAPAPRTELTHCGKEDSNERNPSGVSFVLVQVAFALQRRGEGAPVPCIDFPLRVIPPSAFRIPHYSAPQAHSPKLSLSRVPVGRSGGACCGCTCPARIQGRSQHP